MIAGLSGATLGLAGLGVLLALILVRVPAGLAMLGCGIAGSLLVLGTPAPMLAQLKSVMVSTFSNHGLAVVPLFILMGKFAGLGGISEALFRAADALMGRRRGGVEGATVLACAGFGAICGSSLATAATMGQVALPELKRRGTDDALAAGVLAAGGTLGILIPPSVVLVIYAILVEQNVATLFAAALIPGLLAVLGYLAVVWIITRNRPQTLEGDGADRADLRAAVRAVWPAAAIFLIVIGGIYSRIFTPAEGASVGVVATAILAFTRGGLNRRTLLAAFKATAITTAMIYFILLGAEVFNSFLALTRLPAMLASFIAEAPVPPHLLLAVVLLGFVILGCVMESLSMIILAVPVVFPALAGLDFGLTHDQFAVWFGILVLIVVELGLITPPVGLNLFVIRRVAPTIEPAALYRGVLPFVGADLIRIGLLVAVPWLSLVLTGLGAN